MPKPTGRWSCPLAVPGSVFHKQASGQDAPGLGTQYTTVGRLRRSFPSTIGECA